MRENNNCFDLVVIGSGPAGYVAAVEAAKKQLKVAVIEKDELGGVCLNTGCIPTKTFLQTAKIFHHIQEAEKFAIVRQQETKIDFSKLVIQKDQIVKKLQDSIAFLFRTNKIKVFLGKAFFHCQNDDQTYQIKVNNQFLVTKYLLLATGSEPKLLPITGLKDKEKIKQNDFVVTNKELLEKQNHFKTLTIIGGGVIGIEFAYIYASAGVKVTILQAADLILEYLDEDLSQAVTKILTALGVKIITNVKIKEVEITKRTVFYEDEDKIQKEILSDRLLVAVGRQPSLFGFEKAKLVLGKRGEILVKKNYETNLKNVYAIGDVIGQKMLAHLASMQAIKVIKNITNEQTTIVDLDLVPNCIYIFPEVATVGLSERECQEQKREIKKIKVFFNYNGKAVANRNEEGFIKIIFDKISQEIIGVHLIAETATDFITQISALMSRKAHLQELRDLIFPHPSFVEIINEINKYN